MRVIWKYGLSRAFEGDILRMPIGAEPLTAQVQDGVPVLWVKVDPTQPNEDRHFHLFGTGDDVPDTARYIATLQTPPWVWHVHEIL